MKNNSFSEPVRQLLEEKPRWWVRYGNGFVLLFFAGVLYFLAQIKTTERTSYPVYFETAENGQYRFKAPAALAAEQLNNCELHFATSSPAPQKLPANTVVTGAAVEFTLPPPAAVTLQPQQQAGTLVYVNQDVSIFSCFVNQLFR